MPPPAHGAAGLQIVAAPTRSPPAGWPPRSRTWRRRGPRPSPPRVAERVARVLALADEFGLPVVSPRAAGERAGIVVVEPLPERLTALTAALFNHGVSVTIRGGRVRLSPHAGTTEETIGMLRSALTAYATAVRPVR